MFMLTANKATVRFCGDVKYHTNHCSEFVLKLVSFSHHINCSSEHIFTTQGSVIKTVILEVTVHAQGTNVLLAYGIL
jgi:hypothetical protein